MKGDEILRVPFLKKILIFDKYPYISKMLAYGTNVPWLKHQSALAGAPKCPGWSTFRAQRIIVLTLRDSGAIFQR